MPEAQIMQTVPLLRLHQPDSVFAIQNGNAITARRFLADVLSLAEMLPEHPFVLNLCADRYRFVVVFSAAMLRGQITLLPPNQTPDLIRRLKQRYPGLYCLADGQGKNTT